IVGTSILVVEIIRVFPNVHAKQGRVTIHQWAVLIRRRDYFKFSAFVFDQPSPTTSETTGTSCREFFLERVKASESGFDVISKFARGLATSIRTHDFPEKRMVGVAAAIVSHDGAN